MPKAMSTVTFGILSPRVAEPAGTYEGAGASFSPHSRDRWIEVLVDVPFDVSLQNTEEETEERLYTYRVPEDLAVQPGDILAVPFGFQQLRAIAIRLTEQLPDHLTPDRIKDVEEIICKGFLTPQYQALLNQVALYYQTDLIRVIRVALPPGLLKRSQRRIRLISEGIPDEVELFLRGPALQVLRLLQASPTGDYAWDYIRDKVKAASRGVKDLLQRRWAFSYLEPPKKLQPKLQQAIRLKVNPFAVKVTERQREILLTLRDCGGEMWVSEFIELAKTTANTLKKLNEQGYVNIEEQETLRLEQGIEQATDIPKKLNRYQAAALEVITDLSEFSQLLLHGITGAGKTEIYLQAIAPILARGQSALILVPEIGLTPQLTDRFRARYGEQVCVYHSALSEGERYDTWRYMIQGIPLVVIGTRSAIFAPLPNLALIILDEEHDSSFKQSERPPLYHARTVAQWRAELENCPLILGSATPSLECWQDIKKNPNPTTETYYLSLPERIFSRPLPPIKIVDMRQELQRGNRSIFSTSLQTALQQMQEQQQQGILFIHRRGHSTFVSCRSCGYVIECPNCDVSLSYHKIGEGTTEFLRCHYCNHLQPQPRKCPECSSPYFKNFGSGTQRVEQELKQLFPQLRTIRFDSDTTAKKDAHRRLLTQFANREADILIGTQMVAKGLDLAQVTLVGVVSADGLLHFSDYRARERAFQILTQVSGRAGRGDDPGQVIVQTYTPEHPVIHAVVCHTYEAFAEAELQERRQHGYPPYRRLILLRLSGPEAAEVEQVAFHLASILTPTNDQYDLLGPAPAPILRVANRYRWQILLKFPLDAPATLPEFGRLRQYCPPSVSLTVDVDPLNLG